MLTAVLLGLVAGRGQCCAVLSGIPLMQSRWTCTASGNESGVSCCKRRCVKQQLHVQRYWTCWLSCSGQGRSARWRPMRRTLRVQVTQHRRCFDSVCSWESLRRMLVDFVQGGWAMPIQLSALSLCRKASVAAARGSHAAGSPSPAVEPCLPSPGSLLGSLLAPVTG